MLREHRLPPFSRAPALDDLLCCVEAFKARIGLAIAFSALAGLAVTPGPAVPFYRIVALGVAVMMASAAAGAFNQIVERDLDAKMRRTRHRGFVTGRLHAGPAWWTAIAAVGFAGIALACVALNAMTALYIFFGAFTYAVIYTVWLKPRTWWNIVVGGLAGSFAVLAGGAVVAPWTLQPMTLAFAVVLFLWTPPHFWSLAIAYHDDYAAAQIPMLPVQVGDARAARIVLASAVLLVMASMVPMFLGMRWIYLATVLPVGGYLLHASVQLARAPGKREAMANFHATLAYLPLLLGSAIVDATVLR